MGNSDRSHSSGYDVRSLIFAAEGRQEIKLKNDIQTLKNDVESKNKDRVAEIATLKVSNKAREEESSAHRNEIDKLKFTLETLSNQQKSLSIELQNSKVREELLTEKLTKISAQNDLLWHLLCDGGVIDCSNLPGSTVEPADGMGNVFN